MTDQPEPVHGCTIDGQPAMPILISEYNQLIADLAALRAVARGYCPACGRGDAAPTADDWEEQRKRAEQAAAKVLDYENRITWHTTCGSCARVLDSSIRETERAVKAEAVVARVQALADQWAKAGPPPLGTPIARWVDRRLVELNTALKPTEDPAP